MSLRTPARNPPYPYPQRGLSRSVKRLPKGQRGRRRGKKNVKGMFARERRMEDAFKFGQIRSGLEGIATFRGQTERKPSREQVASDFMTIHAKSLKNQERDKEDKEFMKSHPKLEDWSERTAGAIQEKKEEKAVALRLEDRKQSAFERNATDQLQLQRDALHQQGRISYDAKADRARMMDTLETELRNHNDRWRDTEYRTGARDSKIFSVIEGLSQRLSGEGAQVGGIQSLPSSVARRPSVAFSTSSDEPQIEEIEVADEPLLRQVSGGGEPKRNYADFSSLSEERRQEHNKLYSALSQQKQRVSESQARQYEITGEPVGAPKGLSDVGGFLQTEEAQPSSLMGALSRTLSSPRRRSRELSHEESERLSEQMEITHAEQKKLNYLREQERGLSEMSNLEPKETGLSRSRSGEVGRPILKQTPVDWGGGDTQSAIQQFQSEGGGMMDVSPRTEASITSLRLDRDADLERRKSVARQETNEPEPEPQLRRSPSPDWFAQQEKEAQAKAFSALLDARERDALVKAQAHQQEMAFVRGQQEPREVSEERKLQEELQAQHEEAMRKIGQGSSVGGGEGMRQRKPQPPPKQEGMGQRTGRGRTPTTQRQPPPLAFKQQGSGEVEEVEEEQPAPKQRLNPLERYSRELSEGVVHNFVGTRGDGHPLKADAPKLSLQPVEDGLFKKGKFRPKKGQIMDVIKIDHAKNRYTTRLRSKSNRDGDGNEVQEGLGGWANYKQADINKLIDEGKLKVIG